MKIDVKYVLIGILALLLLLGGSWAGYKIYPVRHPCPVTTSDTIYVHDTVTHSIPDTIPYYIVKTDSIIIRDTVFKDVDTAEILKDYYALHYYTRLWEDSLLTVKLNDVITENKSVDNTFTYKILRPQTVIHNETNSYSYSRYITVGADLPWKSIKHLNLNVDVRYIMPKWYVGIGYNAELDCPTAIIGATVWKLK